MLFKQSALFILILTTLCCVNSTNRSSFVPPKAQIHNIVITRNGTPAVHYVIKNKHYILMNKKRSGPFKWAKLTNSADGKQCLIKIKLAKKLFLNINGKTHGQFDAVQGPYFFKAKPHFLYFYKQKNSWYLAYNKQRVRVIKTEKAPLLVEPFFSPNNQPRYLRYRKGSLKYLPINGQLYGPYQSFSLIHFSTNEKEFAFAFKKNNQWYIRHNNKIVGPYAGRGFIWLCKKRGKLTYSYKQHKQWYVRYGKKSFGPYQWVGNFTASSKHTTIAWRYRQNNKEYIQLNNTTFGPFDTLQIKSSTKRIVLSANGKQAAFVYQKGKQCFVYNTGKNHGPYATVKALSFTEGQSLSWIYHRIIDSPHREQQFIYWAGRRFGPFEQVMNMYLSSTLQNSGFSYMRDGEHFVWAGGHTIKDIPRDRFKMANDPFSFSFFYYDSKKARWFIHLRGKRTSVPGKLTQKPHLHINWDTRKIALHYRFFKEDKLFLRVNSETHPLFDTPSNRRYVSQSSYSVQFSKDLKNYGFIYRKNGLEYLRLAGKSYGPYKKAVFHFIGLQKIRLAYLKKGKLYTKRISIE